MKTLLLVATFLLPGCSSTGEEATLPHYHFETGADGFLYAAAPVDWSGSVVRAEFALRVRGWSPSATVLFADWGGVGLSAIVVGEARGFAFRAVDAQVYDATLRPLGEWADVVLECDNSTGAFSLTVDGALVGTDVRPNRLEGTFQVGDPRVPSKIAFDVADIKYYVDGVLTYRWRGDFAPDLPPEGDWYSGEAPVDAVGGTVVLGRYRSGVTWEAR